LWLLGIAVQIGGFAAHAVTLRSGPLATVQMLVSAELVVAVVIVRIWSGRPLGRASWAAALTVVASVAAFLELTSAGHSPAAGRPDSLVAAGLGAAATGAGALADCRPMVTLPVIAAVAPVASVAVGIGLLGEAPRTDVAGGVAAGFAVLITSLALACLARSAPHPEPRGRRPADGERVGVAVLSGPCVPVAARSAP